MSVHTYDEIGAIKCLTLAFYLHILVLNSQYPPPPPYSWNYTGCWHPPLIYNSRIDCCKNVNVKMCIVIKHHKSIYTQREGKYGYLKVVATQTAHASNFLTEIFINLELIAERM